MTQVFDGRAAAREILAQLHSEVTKLQAAGIVPNLASIYLTTDPGSALYTKLKKGSAEVVGIKFTPVEISVKDERQFTEAVERLNNDANVHGILIQKPAGDNDFEPEAWNRIILSLNSSKDVDGLLEDSPFLTPVVSAVLVALEEGLKIVRPSLKEAPYKVVVVGSRGFVGRKILKRFGEYNPRIYSVTGADVNVPDLKLKTGSADILISATGAPGLVKKDMVKEGVVLIDVGSPKGDIEKDAYEKAAFISPAPGGVGPLTIACLLENVLEAAKKWQSLFLNR